MTLIKGADVSAVIKGEISEMISGFGDRKPCLAIVRIGSNPSDLSYEKGTIKTCESLGLICKVFSYPEDISQSDFEKEFTEINNNNDIHGILVFRPLPGHIDEKAIGCIIDPAKDVDCMSPVNHAKLISGEKDGFYPCTAEAVIRAIDFTGVECSGKKAVIIGRSQVVGKPLGLMLLSKNATITWCHSHTKDIIRMCEGADIIVSAAGIPELIRKEHVEKASENCIVIDVGINFKDGKMCGDVSFEEVSPLCGFITPVPGGVGGVTNVILAEHVVKAAKKVFN